MQTDRLNIRLMPSAKATLKRAAQTDGQTISGYVLAAALSRAEKSNRKNKGKK